jgi:hypothetical protein
VPLFESSFVSKSHTSGRTTFQGEGQSAKGDANAGKFKALGSLVMRPDSARVAEIAQLRKENFERKMASHFFESRWKEMLEWCDKFPTRSLGSLRDCRFCGERVLNWRGVAKATMSPFRSKSCASYAKVSSRNACSISCFSIVSGAMCRNPG